MIRIGWLVLASGGLGLFLGLGHVATGLAGSGFRRFRREDEVQLASGEVHAGDLNRDRVADRDPHATSLADNAAGARFDIPPVVGQIGESDQSVHAVLDQLYEDADVGDTGDEAFRVFTQTVGQKPEDFDESQLALGGLGVALGVAAVCADLGQRVRGRGWLPWCRAPLTSSTAASEE